MTALLSSLEAATFYIDYATGSDGNAGTSQSTPWKRAPGMKGFAGSYNHVSGDRFIFKGGIRWPVDCFQMKITAGGSSDSNRDYYGADTSWFAGSSFTRPLFDFQHTLVGPGWTAGAGVLVEGCQYITFENIDLANHRTAPAINGNNTWGTATICLSTVSYFTLSNCVVRDWDMATPIVLGSSGGGGIIRVNSGDQNRVLRCTFHQKNVAVKSGTSIWNIGEVGYSEICYTATAVMSAQWVHNNYMHHLLDPTDVAAHTNVMLCPGGLRAFNNIIHDISPFAQIIFVAPGYFGVGAQDWIYNNIVYNVSQPCIAIDTDGRNAQTAGSHIFNNTLVGSNPIGNCIRVGHRNNGPFPLLEVRNNHFITDGNPILKDNLAFNGGIVTEFIASGNIHHGKAQAGSFGYSAGNRYAPASSGAPTAATLGMNLSSIFTMDVYGNPRVSQWDIGAHQYGGASKSLAAGASGSPSSSPATPAPAPDPAPAPAPAPDPAPAPSPGDSGQLFDNYSFESGYTGWTSSGNQMVTSSAPYVAVDQKNLVAFNTGQSAPNGVLAQTINTTAGQTYTLEFSVGVLAYNANEQRLQVTVTGSGTLLSRTLSLYGNGIGTPKWSDQSFTFVADSSETTVAFKDVSVVTHDLDLLLDQVSVTATGGTPAASGFANGGFESAYEGWSQSGYQYVGSSSYFQGAEGSNLVVFNAGDMPANAVLSRSFATTPGQKYRLSFQLGVYSYVWGEQRISVEAQGNGALLSASASINGSRGGRVAWAPQSFTFVADSSVTRLTFRDVSPTSFSIDMLLDKVQVQPVN